MVESVAWGGCWVCAAEIGLGWWVCVGFVDSVGLGLCRGLGWLNRWLGVVVGFALPRSVVVVVAVVGGKELLDIPVLLAVNK